MKKIFLILIFCGFGAVLVAQQVEISQDQCVFCTMVVRDQRFSAIAVGPEGNVRKFDAIECLINFLKDTGEETFQKLLVADYSNGSWVEARSATYLKSNAIPSPMGAYLSGYEERAMAQKVQKDKSGELFTWEQVRDRFRESSFGLLDHPDHHHDRPDAYAPIGIMGDHVHHRGSFMLSMSYMHMAMEGNLTGTSIVPEMEIYQNYMVAPQRMQMDMCMLGVMYAPTDRLTFMVMQPFIKKQMDLSTMAGMDFDTKSTGFGDTRISALYSLWANEKISFHVNSGLSIPRGKVSQTDDTPMAQDVKLPYPMQTGSGTVDVFFGATFRQAYSHMSWGLQQLNMLRTGKNPEGYRQGNEFKINAWGSYRATSWMSLSARAEGVMLTRIVGRDDDLNLMMSPAADIANSGCIKVRSFAGANFSFSAIPVMKHVKIGLEYGLPVYQHVRGVQMNEVGTFNAGVRYLL